MDIPQLWRTFYPDKSPISHLLRGPLSDIWLRIHSLPQSKRYADKETETSEILQRYNRVADEILEENHTCALFFPSYADRVAPALLADFEWQFFEQFRSEDLQVTMFAAEAQWESHKFDALLRRIADDEIRYVSRMNVQTGEIFAPYDGGADLFLVSTERRDALKTKYKAWLSAHPKGF